MEPSHCKDMQSIGTRSSHHTQYI